MGWMSGWSGIFRLGNRRWVEDEMVHEMAAGMKKIKGSSVREELAVWGEWQAGGGLGAKIRGVTLCNPQWSYKPSCCNIVNAEVFLFEKWFDTFMQEKGVVGYRVQNQSLCVGVHRGETAWGVLGASACLQIPVLVLSRKQRWITVSFPSGLGLFPMVWSWCCCFEPRQAELEYTRCKPPAGSRHRTQMQSFWIILGWNAVLFLSLSERVESRKRGRVVFLTDAATDKRTLQL